MGFFGYTTQAKGAPQPRWTRGRESVESWRARLDVDRAMAAVMDVLSVWREVSMWPDAQPFSGGVYDAWPHRLARGLAVCRAEAAAVREYLAGQQRTVARG